MQYYIFHKSVAASVISSIS